MDLAARDLRPVPAVPMAVVVAAKYFAVPLTVPFDLQRHFQADLRYRLGFSANGSWRLLMAPW